MSMIQGDASILDLGGTVEFWQNVPELFSQSGIKITVINPELHDTEVGNVIVRQADGCNLAEFPDQSFDIVHSNSVIEHVGDWEAMAAFAKEVRRLAPRYFVQTPNSMFPFEPHYGLPLIHWLPVDGRARLLKRLGRVPQNHDLALAAVERIRLIGRKQLARLFPDGQLMPEKMLGLTKSWMVVRA